MGSGASTSSTLKAEAQSEASKPLDGSDCTTLEDAQAEIARLRMKIMQYNSDSLSPLHTGDINRNLFTMRARSTLAATQVETLMEKDDTSDEQMTRAREEAVKAEMAVQIAQDESDKIAAMGSPKASGKKGRQMKRRQSFVPQATLPPLMCAIVQLDFAGVKAEFEARGGDACLVQFDTVTSNTPLHLAVMFEKPEVVKWLISLKQDVDAANVLSRTPLHIAAITGNVDIAKILMGAGADKLRADAGDSNDPSDPQYQKNVLLPRDFASANFTSLGYNRKTADQIAAISDALTPTESLV